MSTKNRAETTKLCGENFTLNNIMPDNKYQYDILKPEHIDRVTELFTHAFCDDEPMTHYLHMRYGSYSSFAKAITAQAAADGYSVVALDGDTVIACALNEDLADIQPIPIDFDPNFRYIIALLENLGADYFKDKQFSKKEIAHLFITAVAKKYRHQGLSTQVNFRAMDLAAHKGFKFMYCELTNIFNEKGIMHHLKNHKRLIGSCAYDTFTHEGIKPFSHLSGSANAYLWELSKNQKLTYMLNNKTYSEKI